MFGHQRHGFAGFGLKACGCTRSNIVNGARSGTLPDLQLQGKGETKQSFLMFCSNESLKPFTNTSL